MSPGEERSAASTPEREVCEAAKNLLLAIDGFLAENEWPEMPFGVHCALIVLGEKIVALDEAMAANASSGAGR